MVNEKYADDAITTFRKIYPEPKVMIRSVSKLTNEGFLIHASFPDGTFWFTVDPVNQIVSSSYDSYKDAKQAIG